MLHMLLQLRLATCTAMAYNDCKVVHAWQFGLQPCSLLCQLASTLVCLIGASVAIDGQLEPSMPPVAR